MGGLSGHPWQVLVHSLWPDLVPLQLQGGQGWKVSLGLGFLGALWHLLPQAHMAVHLGGWPSAGMLWEWILSGKRSNHMTSKAPSILDPGATNLWDQTEACRRGLCIALSAGISRFLSPSCWDGVSLVHSGPLAACCGVGSGSWSNPADCVLDLGDHWDVQL